jgi:hypothetical protein
VLLRESAMRTTVQKGLWSGWTVRVDGFFIENFWSESRARRVAMHIEKALYAHELRLQSLIQEEMLQKVVSAK